MIDSKTLHLITQNGLEAFALGRILDGIAALHTLLPYCATETIICAEAESLEKNYQYMLSFLRKGGEDQERGEVLEKIQQQGIVLLMQASRAIRISQGIDHYSKTFANLPPNILDKWSSLLTPEEIGETQDDLFDLLWTSPIWTAQDTARWYDFILGQQDMVQQHLAGAIFLAAWEHYDEEKMQLLGFLVDSECSRTRLSAVAYLLLLRFKYKELVPLMSPLPQSILTHKGRQLIPQLQYEMLIMLLSEKDMKQELEESESLTRDLLTNLKSIDINKIKAIIELKGRYLKNRLQRGFDPNLSRAPLLHTCKYLQRISHWFLPFDKTHPLFQSVMIDEKGNERQNLSSLVDFIMDCDVDKLATLYHIANDKEFSTVAKQLDDQKIPDIEDAIIPEYGFRFIIQDLYRFFLHSPLGSQLVNPFREEGTLLDFPDLAALFNAEECIDCCSMLLELGRDKEALTNLDNFINREGASVVSLILKGQIFMQTGRYTEAIASLRSAEMLQADNINILHLIAECYAALHRFEEELEYLQRLAELFPEEDTYRRLVPMTMVKAGRYEEALQLLFKLDYEASEDDKTIIDAIASTALKIDKLDIAERYTEKELQLTEGKRWQAHLRAGHIKLLQSNWKSCIDSYEQFVNFFCEDTGKDAKAALALLSKELDSLIPKGINKDDTLLIHDIVQAAVLK